MMTHSLIGNTPLIPYKTDSNHPIFLKMEGYNPTGSMKDRIVYPMLSHAGLNKQTVLVADWGPLAVSTAWTCQWMGYPCECFLPCDTPVELWSQVCALGATLHLKNKTLYQLQHDINQLAAQYPDQYYALDPFFDGENPMSYAESMGKEIWEQTNGSLSGIVCATETCGCLMGCSTALKMHNPDILAVGASLLGKSSVYGILDPNADDNSDIFVPQLTDDIVYCTLDESEQCQKEILHQEGLFCGIVGSTALCAAEKIQPKHNGCIVVVLPSRYKFY